MIIYLAGGISGNLNGDWKRIMDVYLASLSNEKVGYEVLILPLSRALMLKVSEYEKNFRL